MLRKGLIAACFAALAATLDAVPAEAQQRAGNVITAQQDAFQARSAIGNRVDVGATVFKNARLYTKAFGGMEVRFLDNTNLLLSPNSSITIDDYVFDGGGPPKFSMRLLQGAMRMISGRMPKETYAIDGQVAAIGVRGTRLWLDVQEPGILKIWTDEGTVVARPINGDREFVFEAPIYAECTDTTCVITPAPPQPEKFPTDPRAR